MLGDLNEGAVSEYFWQLFVCSLRAVAPIYSELLSVPTQASVDAHTNGHSANETLDPLSPREQQILKLVVCGVSTKEISKLLNVSVHTANSHLKGILSKTGAESIPALIRYSLLNGLV